MTVGLIWAQSANGVIGRDGTIPWYLPEDLAHFASTTAGTTVVMGRRTWDSLPDRFRPLPGRRNIVVTRDPNWSASGAERATSIEDALTRASNSELWVIGGAQLYSASIDVADVLEVTEIGESFDGDTSAPDISAEWVAESADQADGWQVSRAGLPYRFIRYRKRSRPK